MEHKDYKLIAKRMRDCREERDLTLEDIGKIVGTHKSTVQRWETGETQKISLPTVQVLANYYNVNVKWLMGESVSKKPFDIFSIPGITPIEKKRFPLLGSTGVACGEPIFADNHFEGYIEAGADIRADFCLRANGDSMINARIFDGDIVFIRSQPDVEDGEIAVVLIDDEATLKRVYKYPNRIELRPENPTCRVQNYEGSALENIRILGKAVAFQSDIK